jgi:hypothetical protein
MVRSGGNTRKIGGPLFRLIKQATIFKAARQKTVTQTVDQAWVTPCSGCYMGRLARQTPRAKRILRKIKFLNKKFIFLPFGECPVQPGSCTALKAQLLLGPKCQPLCPERLNRFVVKERRFFHPDNLTTRKNDPVQAAQPCELKTGKEHEQNKSIGWHAERSVHTDIGWQA